MYLLQEGRRRRTPRVNLLGSGTILRESDRRAGAAREATGAWPPTSGAARASTSWRATARTASAGTCCTRPSSRACRSSPQQLEQARRPGDRLDRLHEELRRADPRLHAEGPHLQGARHRRLRPQRLPQQAARALRGQPPLHRRRGAEGAGRGRRAAGRQGGRGDQASTASTPTRSTRCTPERTTQRRRQRHGIGGSEGPGHRRLQGRRGHRGAGQARRHDQGRAVADHGRERQGVDGDPVERTPAWSRS